MASLLNALQLALGAGGAGISGYQRAQAQREEEERLKREEARRVAAEKKAAERQAMADALELADRGALPTAQSQALGQRAVGEIAKSVSGAMGAFQSGAQTPFDAGAIAQGAGRMGAPAAKFTVGGVEYTLPDQEQRRRALEAQSLATELAKRESFSRIDQETKIRADQREMQRIKELSSAAKKGGRNSEAAIELAVVSPQAYNAIYPEPQRASALDALRAEEAMRERQAQEAQGMAFLNANRTNNEVKAGYGAIFAANPKMSPGMIGYALQQQALAGALESQREASAGASAARTDATKAKTAGRAPSTRPPGASKAPAATPPAPAPDELDAAYDKYTTRKR